MMSVYNKNNLFKYCFWFFPIRTTTNMIFDGKDDSAVERL